MNSIFMVLVFSILCVCNQIQAELNNPNNTFLYFGYGSNMLTKRIHKNNPSAKFKAIAKLKNHRLDFIMFAKSWHGCVATIVPTDDSDVWGVAWEISLADLPKLDRQEGVFDGVYFAKNVTVQTPNGESLECRTYEQTLSPDKYVPPNELPDDRLPSPVYMNTIIEGAREHDIPSDYVKFLQSFRHSDYQGEVKIP